MLLNILLLLLSLAKTKWVINHVTVHPVVSSVLRTGLTAGTGKMSHLLRPHMPCTDWPLRAPALQLALPPLLLPEDMVHPEKEENRTQKIAKDKQELILRRLGRLMRLVSTTLLFSGWVLR